ncbi:MAG: SPOR domain-containing protein [Gammaproteobacteria bacterium]|nr:SPOR domain-containing protein [Gammaproteobacteria bacterium]
MPEQPSADEQNEIKKRAVRRVIVASLLVAAAIAALTVVTGYREKTPITSTSAPDTVLAPIKQAEPVAPPPEETVAPPTIPPEQEAQTTTPPPPPPEVVNAPLQPAPAETAEKAAKPVRAKPGAGAEMSARPTPAKPPAAQPSPEAHPVREAPPAKAAKEIAAEKAPPAKAAEAAAAKGYTVQLGVFSNPANAMQLQEKLLQSGIKSYTETRLNVGPFQSKAEAEQALAKIRSLGISAVVVPVH